MEELADYPEIVTREYYKSIGSRPEPLADDEFDKWVGVGEPQLVKATIENEILELGNVSDIIRRYVNRHIAHKAQKPGKDVPSHEDVTKCFKLVADLIARYYLLLKSTSLRPGKVAPDHPLSAFFREPTEEEMMIVPNILRDWKAVFRIPWED